MAMKIVVNIAKKVPIAGIDYSSQTASCSIETECSSGKPQEEAAALYRLAEAAVDSQLKATPGQPPVARQAPATSSGGNGRRTQPAATHGRSSGSYGSPRRIPPATDSQMRLLQRLVNGDGQQRDTLLARYAIRDLSELNVAQASEAIDLLKQDGSTCRH